MIAVLLPRLPKQAAASSGRKTVPGVRLFRDAGDFMSWDAEVSKPPHHNRGGWSLVESLVALLLSAFVIQLSVRALTGARAAQNDLYTQAEWMATQRLARSTLGLDLAVGQRSTDWTSFPPDSVSLRAFRGNALVCPELTSGDTVYVAWSGMRLPNPTKDSLRILRSDGSWTDADLLRDHTSQKHCSLDASRTLRRWVLAPGASTDSMTLIRLWERGSYHLVDTVFSYRSRPRKSSASRGSRQPLSPAVIVTPPSRFVDSMDVLSLVLHSRRDEDRSSRIRLGGGNW